VAIPLVSRCTPTQHTKKTLDFDWSNLNVIIWWIVGENVIFWWLSLYIMYIFQLLSRTKKLVLRKFRQLCIVGWDDVDTLQGRRGYQCELYLPGIRVIPISTLECAHRARYARAKEGVSVDIFMKMKILVLRKAFA
jgi:hypothetical protein